MGSASRVIFSIAWNNFSLNICSLPDSQSAKAAKAKVRLSTASLIDISLDRSRLINFLTNTWCHRSLARKYRGSLS